MNRLVEVLNKLNSTFSISGSQIAKELGITRAAVWRRIKHYAMRKLGKVVENMKLTHHKSMPTLHQLYVLRGLIDKKYE